MSRAAMTVFVFSIYLYLLGLVLIAFPDLLLALFRIPTTTEVWIRVVGVLVLIIGLYYTTAARHELAPMLRATVVGRFAVLVFFIGFVAAGFAPPILIAFGLIDAAAATWTGIALRA